MKRITKKIKFKATSPITAEHLLKLGPALQTLQMLSGQSRDNMLLDMVEKVIKE